MKKFYRALNIRWTSELEPIPVKYAEKNIYTMAGSEKEAEKKFQEFINKKGIHVVDSVSAVTMTEKPTENKHFRV